MRTLLIAASLLASTAAYATPNDPGLPITTSPGSLYGAGDVNAAFLFVAANDTSNLDFAGFGSNPIFINRGPGHNNPGDTVNLGPQNGLLQFTLNDLTSGISFTNDVADLDGNFHAFYSTNPITLTAATNDFNVNFSQAAIDAVAALGPNVVIVGFEDRVIRDSPNYPGQPASDFDYNDLIYAFAPVGLTQTPEPATVALFGLGLAGIVVGRRRAR